MRYAIQPPDLRRIRAEHLTAAILQEIRPLLPRESERYMERDIHEAIYKLLWRTGVDVISDSDRLAAGLPERGNLGYTHEELRIMEARRMELMLNPFQSHLLSPNNPDKEDL